MDAIVAVNTPPDMLPAGIKRLSTPAKIDHAPINATLASNESNWEVS
jgi:hypothetical protein